MIKHPGQALLRVLLAATMVVFITSLCIIFCGELAGIGKLVFVLIVVSSFFTSLSLFLRLNEK